jgi:hypothetical protein
VAWRASDDPDGSRLAVPEAFEGQPSHVFDFVRTGRADPVPGGCCCHAHRPSSSFLKQTLPWSPA